MDVKQVIRKVVYSADKMVYKWAVSRAAMTVALTGAKRVALMVDKRDNKKVD